MERTMSEHGSIAERPLASLIGQYKTDPRSPFLHVAYHVRKNYQRLCRRIEVEHGSVRVGQITSGDLAKWRDQWSSCGPAITHDLMRRLRAIFVFGGTVLDDQKCKSLAVAVHELHVRLPRTQRARMTVEYVLALRSSASKRGMHSIALAQSLQYECDLTQKQVIGEWVPLTEAGSSDVITDKSKWMSGIRWSDIDQNMILTAGKELRVDLKRAPMVMEELSRIGFPLPESGPVIVNEVTALPYAVKSFWKEWRAAADAAGIPKTVQNMSSNRRARTVPEQSREIRELRAALHVARDALNGSETLRAQVYKMICETLDCPDLARPNPTHQTRNRYSLWRDPRATSSKA